MIRGSSVGRATGCLKGSIWQKCQMKNGVKTVKPSPCVQELGNTVPSPADACIGGEGVETIPFVGVAVGYFLTAKRPAPSTQVGSG